MNKIPIPLRELPSCDGLSERKPKSNRWRSPKALRSRPMVLDALMAKATWWQRERLTVLSALQWVQPTDPAQSARWEWHLSVTRRGERATDADVALVRLAFGIEDAEEDNHMPGKTRNLILPVLPEHRKPCECKTIERVITEPDGFQWTNPINGACRGCEHAALFGSVCPLHGGEKTSP